jgi:hypothetical protein
MSPLGGADCVAASYAAAALANVWRLAAPRCCAASSNCASPSRKNASGRKRDESSWVTTSNIRAASAYRWDEKYIVPRVYAAASNFEKFGYRRTRSSRRAMAGS